MTEEGKCCAVTGIGKFEDPLTIAPQSRDDSTGWTIAPQSRDDFMCGRLLCNRVMPFFLGGGIIVVQLRCEFLCYFFFLKADVYFIVVFVGEGMETGKLYVAESSVFQVVKVCCAHY